MANTNPVPGFTITPERFISIADGEIISYFKTVFPESDASSLYKLHDLVEGLCIHSFSRLRRAIEQDFAYFINSAAGNPGRDPREHDPMAYSAELDAQEERFLGNFFQLVEATHYKILTSEIWNTTRAEDFLVTLPVSVNYDIMDDKVLPRALWRTHPEQRAAAPEELADRIVILHRGMDIVRIQGRYFFTKIDLMLTYFILQPIFKFFAVILSLLRIKTELPDTPAYVATSPEPSQASGTHYYVDDHTSASASSSAFASAANTKTSTVTKHSQHPHTATVSIERRTFARIFPSGVSVIKQFFNKIELQEACFKDVIVLYRKSVPDGPIVYGETDLIHSQSDSAHPAFLKRNFIIKRFASIPIADLELVFPDKKIYMPPQVLVEMFITLVGALIAIVSAIKGGLAFKNLWPLLTMLGSRAAQVYTTAQVQRTTIEHTMQRLLYDRTIASQMAVLECLTEEMSRQHIREIIVAYCILAISSTSSDKNGMTPDELDVACETLLSSEFGLDIDFTVEDALPTLLEWGLVVQNPETGTVKALELNDALAKLDAVWDNLYTFSTTKENATALVGLVSRKFNAIRMNAIAGPVAHVKDKVFARVKSTRRLISNEKESSSFHGEGSESISGRRVELKRRSFFGRLTMNRKNRR